MKMLLHMQDYVNSLVAIGTKHLRRTLVKLQFPSRGSRFDSRNEKHL